LLTAAVIAIWSIIGYKLYQFLNQNNTTQNARIESTAVPEKDSVVTYALLANYKDPFLTRTSKTLHTLPYSKSSRQAKVPVSPKEATPWPLIKYKGLVENNSASRRIALIYVGGVSSLVKEGDFVGALKVTRIWNDSVKIEMNSRIRYVRKD